MAGDPEVLAWLQTLPERKRQANLVFAAARWHGVPAPGPYAGLRTALLADDGTIRATILERSTQTNEVGRLACLYPAFAQLAPTSRDAPSPSSRSGPVPDSVSTPTAPVRCSSCTTTGDVPRGTCSHRSSGARGIDLSPIDVNDDEAVRWLETLVWPEQEDRRERLRAAVEIARSDPPYLVQGDLFDELPALMAQAPTDATLIVFHSAVIAYLEAADRERFAAMMAGLVADGRCHWVSNEGPRVLPGLVPTGGRRPVRPVRARRRRPSGRAHARPRQGAGLALSPRRREQDCPRWPRPDGASGRCPAPVRASRLRAMDTRVLIVGGGVAGLATARAPAPPRGRCGRGRARRRILTRGVGCVPAGERRPRDRSARAGRGARGRRRSGSPHQQLPRPRGGRTLFEVDLADFWKATGPCLALGHTDLHDLLGYAASPSARTDGDGAPRGGGSGSTATFDDGSTDSVRRGGRRRRRPLLGAICVPLRGATTFPGPGRAGGSSPSTPPEVPGWTVWLGRRATFLAVPLGRGRTYCFAAVDRGTPAEPTDGRRRRVCSRLFGRLRRSRSLP